MGAKHAKQSKRSPKCQAELCHFNGINKEYDKALKIKLLIFGSVIYKKKNYKMCHNLKFVDALRNQLQAIMI